MSIVSWLKRMIGAEPCQTSKADRALVLSDEAIMSARGLRQQLEPFKSERDPFSAVTRKTLLARSFQERVESDTPRAKP